jgi:transcriptional adapter 2-alpha
MPKRKDFDTEFNSEADKLISELEFGYQSDDNEESLKYKDDILILFNRIVDDRLKHKQFVIDRGILEKKRVAKKRSKEEMEIVNAFKVFAKFNN